VQRGACQRQPPHGQNDETDEGRETQENAANLGWRRRGVTVIVMPHLAMLRAEHWQHQQSQTNAGDHHRALK
jgi:hypothetical protein